MKKIILAIAVLIFSASCKKSHEEEKLPLKTVEEITIMERKQVLEPVSQGHETFNLVGYGYDVTGKFNDASSARAAVIDVESYDKNHNLSVGTSGWFYSNMHDGENAEILASTLSNKTDETKGRKLYGETIRSFFPGESPFSERYIYGFYSKVSSLKSIWFGGVEHIVKYLYPAFKDDIQNMNAENLVKKYGTHVLTYISLGGKLNIIYQAETTSFDRRNAQNAGFDFAIKKVFYFSPERMNDVDSNRLRTIKSPKVAYEVFGGDAAKIRLVNTVTGILVDTYTWSDSINLKTAAFIAANKMVPITTLIADQAKKTEVENYIKGYLNEKEVQLTN